MAYARSHWKAFLAVSGLLLLSLAAYRFAACYVLMPVHLTLSGGSVCPLRSEMAQRIHDEVSADGIVLEPVRDTSSESVCSHVDNHALDLGLVLGGFPVGAYANVRQVATLGVEPLQLLVRGELVGNSPLTLELLRGRRVSLGEQGTNGELLAADLLSLAGLRPATPKSAGDFMPVYSTEAELLGQLRAMKRAAAPVRDVLAQRLPDAVLIVDSIPSELVDEFVRTAGYRFVPLPYATALHLDIRRDHGAAGRQLESSRIEPAVIPAYAYGIEPAAPPVDFPTIGLRLLLVAHKDVANRTVDRLLRSLDKGMAQRYHVDLDAGNVNTEFPLHPGAAAFAAGRRPAAVGEWLQSITNFLSVVGAGAAGGLALWGFVRGLRAIHPDVHLKQIDRIERLLTGRELDESAPQLPLEFVNFLESRLAHIKQTAIDDFADGRLEGDQALVSILTLVADTRHLLVQRRKQLCQEASAGEQRFGRRSEAA